MIVTAVVTWWVRVLVPGHFTPIHLFSLLVLFAVPLAIRRARNHQVEKHRGTVLRLMTGGLVLAGFFTFLPQRLLGGWLIGQ